MSDARNVDRSSELARNEGRNDKFELARNEGRNGKSEPAGNEDLRDAHTYRGRDIDELLPKIREELGADAIVIRQREGLDGGVAGFFQKRCVEVVARRATPGVDSYDGSGTAAQEPAPVAPEPPAPAIAEIMRVASPFIEQLRAAEESIAEPEPEPEVAVASELPVTGAFGTTAYAMSSGAGAAVALAPAVEEEPVPAPSLQLVANPRSAVEHAAAVEPAERSGAAATHQSALVAAGIDAALAAEIVDATISHVMPFGPRRTVKRALREALARRIPLTPPTRPGSRAVAFVGAGGSGKTLCATRLAAAYAARSDLAVNIVDLQDGRPDGDPLAAPGTLNVVDTPAVSPGSPADVKKLATELRRLGSLEVHVAVPATLSAAAVRTLLDGLAPLKPAAIMLTHLDEVEHAGPVVNEAIARSIAISYTSDGSAPEGFGPADPAALAARVLA